MDDAVASTAGGASGGAAQGAAVGGTFGPPGAAIGAVAGGVIGGVGGFMQGKAQKKQKQKQKQLVAMQAEMQRQEQARRDQNVATVRDTFGVLPGISEQHRNLDKTLTNRSQITNTIDQQAGNARDQVLANNVDAAATANNQTTASLAQRGMIGSSVDENARKNVLSDYALGRSNAVGANNAVQSNGWALVNGRRKPLENLASNGMSTSEIMQKSSELNDIKQARIGTEYGIYGKVGGAILDTAGSFMKSGAASKNAPANTPANTPTVAPVKQ